MRYMKFVHLKINLKRGIFTPIFTTALFTIAKLQKHLLCLSIGRLVNKQNTDYPHGRTVSTLRKEGNHTIFNIDGCDGPERHKWNKWDTERQILDDSSYMRQLK